MKNISVVWPPLPRTISRWTGVPRRRTLGIAAFWEKASAKRMIYQIYILVLFDPHGGSCPKTLTIPARIAMAAAGRIILSRSWIKAMMSLSAESGKRGFKDSAVGDNVS